MKNTAHFCMIEMILAKSSTHRRIFGKIGNTKFQNAWNFTNKSQTKENLIYFPVFLY